MSQQDVELVRSLFDGMVNADKEAMLQMLPEVIEQTFDPEIEWVEDPQRADSRTCRGHAGVRESFERWMEGFDDYSFDVEDVIDCGATCS
jgi:ketosteroid isomerase-like protein